METTSTAFNELPAELLVQFSLYSPLDLIDRCERTKHFNIFAAQPLQIDKNKPTIVVVIGPSGGGKDTLVNPLIEQKLGVKVRTATSRARRQIKYGADRDEPQNDYTWMREPFPFEDMDTYKEGMKVEHQLIESDFHHGSFYGLPEQNLVEACNRGEVPIIRTESNAARTFQAKLSDRFNVVTIFVCPPDYETLFRRIQGRNDTYERMKKAVPEITTAHEISNYVVLNSDGLLESTQASLEELYKEIIFHEN